MSLLTPRRSTVSPLAQCAAALVQHEIDAGADPQQAELAVCGAVARQAATELSPHAWRWIERQIGEPFCEAFFRPLSTERTELAAAIAQATRHRAGDVDPLADFYEQLLRAHDPRRRKGRGVFYTPPAIVRFVVRSTAQLLEREFGGGLLDRRRWKDVVETPPDSVDPDGLFLRVLDPALGAGLFLTEWIHATHEAFCATDPAHCAEDWDAFVADVLLPRLRGIEIQPAAAALAIVRIACALAATGYTFAAPAGIDVHIGDALAAPWRPPWTVVIGNPPFSGISQQKHDWLYDLMRGRGPSGEERASYFDVGGAPLGERKHWLEDDYVKFLRAAHDQAETAGVGLVALVTSHGYLDNVSFRGLRDKLVQTYPRITVVDLHGSAKRRERTPDGERDENVFGIEQGIALGFFRRPLGAPAARCERIDLWGGRDAKLRQLEQATLDDLEAQPLMLAQRGAPFAAVIPQQCDVYDAGWPLQEVMPTSTTAPVTARDHFLVAFDQATLRERAADLADCAIPDDVLRSRYFGRTRSRRHAAGDTRGWKLPEARSRMQAWLAQGPEAWRALVRPVAYRPLDERWMLWADWLVDWPRNEVTRHLDGENLVLITRRQSPPGQPWNFAWIADKLALDGVIRSDNRGSESLFPLWLDDGGERRANFAQAWIEQLAEYIGREAAPEEMLAYIYGLLATPAYRARYGERLVNGFPRVLWPAAEEVFARIAELGRKLLETHLLRRPLPAASWTDDSATRVAEGFPRYGDGRLWINPTCGLACDPAVATYRVGTHQVLRKYLRSRLGLPLSAAERKHVARMAAALEETVTLERALDDAIAGFGGMTAAFAARQQR